MTRALPAPATFSELVLTAVRAATHQLSEGSRRNARQALEARYDNLREGAEIIAAFTAPRPATTSVRHRPSA